MKKTVFYLWVFVLGAVFSLRAAEINLPPAIEIPFKKFVLKNGLTLIVHEDRKAPIVAVNVWYHVGSKNEKPGRTGFAHLFEHLMFNGSENFNDDYFKAMDNIGATDLNGTTNEDRTNYFENAPKNALDIVLWLESDRMGHFVGVISKERLDEQRGVVQNEKRQGENQPYGRAYELMVKSTYPANHPYSWTVIGSMEDLNAASLEDVKDWFQTYYGAANATLVVAGDVEAEDVRQRVEKYFGDIPSGPPLSKHEKWIAKRTGTQRQIMHDRVPQARLYKVWNVPAYESDDAIYLDLFASLLTSGKNSRLYNRLVYKEQIAGTVGASNNSREIGGQFSVVVTARPGEDLAKIERVMDEEFQKALKEGPTQSELDRIKIETLADFIKGAERIGGFGGKSDILAMNEVFTGNPEYYKKAMQLIRDAKPEQIRKAAREWLADGDYNLEVHPFPEYQNAKTGADRSKLPELGEVADATFPKLERSQLSNGLKIILAERHTIPTVNVQLMLDAGYAADQFGVPGAAKLAMNMLDEGTKKLSALEISEQLSLLGADVGTGSDLDTSMVSLTALKANLEPSLDLFAEIILNPSFPEADFDRLKKQQLDAIQREKVQPVQMALRVLPQLLYGEGHAYSLPFTGSGNTKEVATLKVEQMRKFYETWFKPDNATLIVVGDTTMEEIKPKLEKRFAGWKGGDVPKKNISKIEQKGKNTVYLMNRPGAIQSTILAGNLTVPKDNPNEMGIEALNNILGGQFTARLNMNLREDKHWSYGAQTMVLGARGQRPFLAFANVQTDKTKESMVEINKEFKDILGSRPATKAEFEKVKRQTVLELAGTWETMGAVAGSIHEMLRYGLPEDYFQTYSEKIRKLNLEQVSDAAKTMIHQDNLTWVIVGDLAKVEKEIRELGLGQITLINADGEIIGTAAVEK